MFAHRVAVLLAEEKDSGPGISSSSSDALLAPFLATYRCVEAGEAEAHWGETFLFHFLTSVKRTLSQNVRLVVLSV